MFTLQTLAPCEPEDRLSEMLGQVAGFSLATRELWSDASPLTLHRDNLKARILAQMRL